MHRAIICIVTISMQNVHVHLMNNSTSVTPNTVYKVLNDPDVHGPNWIGITSPWALGLGAAFAAVQAAQLKDTIAH